MLALRFSRLALAVLAALLPMHAFAQDTAKPASPPFTAGWRDGFVVQSDNGDFRLQFGVFVHTDGRFAVDDSDEAVTNTFAIRRFRPNLRGRFANRFEFYFNPDFAGGSVVVQDAYVDTRFSPAFRIRVGKTKTPLGLERLQSASNLILFERGFPTALAPNRDVGVQLLGDVKGGVISYQAGVLNGVADGGSGDTDNNDAKDLAGRLIVRPFNSQPVSSALRGLGVSLAGSTGKATGAAHLPAIRTPSQLQTFLSYTGASADGTRTRYSPQLFYYFRSFGGFAEYIHTEVPIVKGTARRDIAHQSWQAAGSWYLTGETASDGAVRPNANFDFGAGHWGAFQVAARYHQIEADAAVIALGFATPGSSRKAEGFAVGVNWLWNPTLKYVLNFERTVFDDDPDGPRRAEHAIVFRSQVNF